MSKKLTARQVAFCEEYLKDLNATRAAKAAGYSEKTAGEAGYENLKKPDIQRAIQKAQAERSERTQIDADYVLIGLREIAERADVSDRDQLRALELLGKHLGLFTDKADLGGSEMGVAIQIVKHYDGNDPRLPVSGPETPQD